MNYKKIIAALSTALLLSGCGALKPAVENADTNAPKTASLEDSAETNVAKNSDDTSAAGDNASENLAEDSYTSAESSASSSLSESGLEEYTKLFNTPEYKGFLDAPFNSPEDIDWDSVFFYGAGIDAKDVSDEEINDYLAEIKHHEVYGDLFVIRADDFNDYLKTHLGISAPDKIPSRYWAYVKKYDSYYYYHFSGEDINYKCISGEVVDDTFTLTFTLDTDDHYANKADRVVKFKKSDDDIILESCEILWDDFCDESQSFDVELAPGDAPTRFISYPSDVCGGTVKMILVKAGKYLTNITSWAYVGTETDDIKKINAVSFFDYNGDGVKDILVIGESDTAEHILLEESVPDDSYYESPYGLSEALDEKLAGNYSVDAVKRELLGDNTSCTFDNYKDAYAHIAKLYQYGGNYDYDLIDTDGDDTPEFVVSAGGSVSLYTYENNRLNCLMHSWPYGAMGNIGYEYAPGKGVFFNLNNDFAGLIQNETYMIKREGQGLTADFIVENLMFDDKDGNGEPSDDETEGMEEMEVFSSTYYNYTGEDLTDEEIKEKIALFNTYSFEELYGTKTYDEIMNDLK